MEPRATPSDGSSAPAILHGIGVSPGMAIGPALLFRPQRTTPITHTPAADASESGARVCQALAAAAAELRALAERALRAIGPEAAGILDAQALMLEDPTLIQRVDALLASDQRDGAAALIQAAEEQAQALAALPDPLWQARAADVRDAAARAIRLLTPSGASDDLPALVAHAREPVIVIAHDLAPSDTAQLRRERVLGICTAAGSPTAHAAILARALGIPAVVGLGPTLFDAVEDASAMALDGATGDVFTRPDAATTARFTAAVARQRDQAASARAALTAARARPSQTRDGVPVHLLANVGSVGEAAAAAEAGAEGIGLLRTEFLFAGRPALPDEHEQAALYAAIATALNHSSATIIVRTLDAGNDKPLPALAPYARELPAESNPALGVRGFRLHSVFPALLQTQLRALVRTAAQTGANLHVMLPMVTTVEEVRQARQALRAAEETLAREGVRAARPLPLGIMIETPAAVFAVDALAREAEFFSIGTNDLAQYVMAADRLNPRLTELSAARQPAVLRAIARVAEAARAAGRPVGVCGEMAGDARLAGLLVGLGIDELSMAPASLPGVKRVLALHSHHAWHDLADAALGAATLAEVAAHLERVSVD